MRISFYRLASDHWWQSAFQMRIRYSMHPDRRFLTRYYTFGWSHQMMTDYEGNVLEEGDGVLPITDPTIINC